MNNKLYVYDYAMCCFSVEVLQEFMKSDRIRTNVVSNLQKNPDKYLRSLSKGAWIPISGIDNGDYLIDIGEKSVIFDKNWEKRLEYSGFNIEIKDELWFTTISHLEKFDKNKYLNEKISFETLNGNKHNSGLRFNIKSGKYLMSIMGYERKEKLSLPDVNYGFHFSFMPVDKFGNSNNPREEDTYYFNVAGLERKLSEKVKLADKMFPFLLIDDEPIHFHFNVSEFCEEVFKVVFGNEFKIDGYCWRDLAQVFLKEKYPKFINEANIECDEFSLAIYFKSYNNLKEFTLGFREICDDFKAMKQLLYKTKD